MPFRPPSPSDGPLAKVDCLAEKDPVTVREDHLADVELVAVAVSDPQKVRYGGLAEKEGVDEGSRVGRLRRTTEAALVKTWSYELAATTRYKGVGEAMRVEGGGLRRTVEDFQWCRLALVAEHPGVVVPPLGVEAQAGDADAPARWLMLLLEHPQLKSNDALKVFCLGSPSEFAAAQRDHVPFKDPTPLAVHLGALYIKGRETLSRERKQVIEEDAQEEKDEKRRKAGGHLSSAEIRAFAKWLDEEAAAVSAAAKASAAAVAADAAACAEQKLALASVAALAGSAGSAADAAPPRFGPARALPELNDMVGYLGAAHDAIYGRDVARRTLAVAARGCKQSGCRSAMLIQPNPLPMTLFSSSEFSSIVSTLASWRATSSSALTCGSALRISARTCQTAIESEGGAATARLLGRRGCALRD